MVISFVAPALFWETFVGYMYPWHHPRKLFCQARVLRSSAPSPSPRPRPTPTPRRPRPRPRPGPGPGPRPGPELRSQALCRASSLASYHPSQALFLFSALIASLSVPMLVVDLLGDLYATTWWVPMADAGLQQWPG